MVSFIEVFKITWGALGVPEGVGGGGYPPPK